MALTQVQPGMLGTPQPYNFKNRIINGAQVIDQRNAGTAVTVTGAAQFATDRWSGYNNSDGVFTLQQVSDAPAGFVNSLKATITTADASIGATQYSLVRQRIEGYNIADLNWGSSNAKTITLSFWVKSSLTGTFGGALLNISANRSYPYTYTISTANTWEQKSITITGDTTGTWDTTNGIGVQVDWNLAAGSTYTGAAGSWQATLLLGATGETQVLSTLNATIQWTGAQFEVGVSATTFDYRPYTTELQLCQRYANSTFPIGTAWGTAKGRAGDLEYLSSGTSSRIFVNYVFPVTMRDTPTPTYYNPTNNNTNFYSWSTGSDSSAAGSFGNTSSKGQMIVSASNAAATDNTYGIHASFTAEP